VLLWPTETAGHPPSALAGALNRPAFAPFAGRRSCPLAFPVDAHVIDAATVIEGLRAYDAAAAAQHGLAGRLLPLPAGAREIAFDAALADVAGLVPGRAEWRRDRLASRARRQFEPREEHVAAPPPDAAGPTTAAGGVP